MYNYMIENKSLGEGGDASLFLTLTISIFFAGLPKITQLCGNIRSTYASLLRVKSQLSLKTGAFYLDVNMDLLQFRKGTVK